MSTAFNRMRDEVALGLVAAAFTIFLFVFLPNYQQIAYHNTEGKEFDRYEYYVGYPAADDYPTVNSIEEIKAKRIDTFTIEVDVTSLKPLDLYMNLEKTEFTTNSFARLLSNKGTERLGRFFVLSLASGEEVVVFLDDSTINLPKRGEVTLPIGKLYEAKKSKLFEKLKEVSGIEDIEFYIDMAGDWQDSEEATKLERVRMIMTVVLFFGLWILYSKLLIKLCEKK